MEASAKTGIASAEREALAREPAVVVRTYTDELTGVNNRRGFFELAKEAFASAAASGERCTAVVVDLDRLSHVNETYGHHAGSELIREAAAALVALAHEGDVVGRLGGDELALLRPAGAPAEDELRSQVSEAVAHASRSARPYGLAVSVGVAVALASEVGSIDDLLRRADEAMYEHKVVGGGRRGRPHVRGASRH